MKTNIGKIFAVLAITLALGATLSTSTFAIEPQADADIEVPLSDEGEYLHGYTNVNTIDLDEKQEATTQNLESPQVASVDYASSSQANGSSNMNSVATTKTEGQNVGIFGSIAAKDAAIGTGIVIVVAAILVTLWSKHKFGGRSLEIRKF